MAVLHISLACVLVMFKCWATQRQVLESGWELAVMSRQPCLIHSEAAGNRKNYRVLDHSDLTSWHPWTLKKRVGGKGRTIFTLISLMKRVCWKPTGWSSLHILTDHFALSVADEFLQLFEGSQPAVAIILPGDSAQEVGQPRLLWVSHPSVCKNNTPTLLLLQ